MVDDFELLNETLKQQWVRVNFTKKDGSIRDMLCTRSGDIIPATGLPKGVGRKPNPNVIPVFDSESQQWRSIIVENINNWVPMLVAPILNINPPEEAAPDVE